MRLKKGFTLAEILIVLIVIGAIATMTIPSLMKGVTESQWKTAYKKAYNAIVNLTAMERIAGQLPSSADKVGVGKMFSSLKSSLSVKDYAAAPTEANIASQATYNNAEYYTNIEYKTAKSNGDTEAAAATSTGDTLQAGLIGTVSPWITTEDNLSYVIVAGSTSTGEGQNVTSSAGGCLTKAKINEKETMKDAVGASCVVVVVDVNGLSNGPNRVESQSATTKLEPTASMETLTGDRYYIYIGNDGATAGAKKYLVTGRIVADLK